MVAIAATLVLERHSRRIRSLHQISSRRALPAGQFGSRELTRLLGAAGTIYSLPKSVRSTTTTYRPTIPEQLFSIDPPEFERLSPLLGIEPVWLARGAPAISIQLDPEDWDELRENRLERGPEWERPAHLAYVEDGEVKLSGMVGLRIHGGGGRSTKRYGLRVYFRRKYGLDRLPSEIFSTGGDLPARRIAIRRDGGPGRGDHVWYFMNAISMEIARAIGLPAPYSQPAALFVNGTFMDVRGVIERIDGEYLEAHYGHQNFILARKKKNLNESGSRVKIGDAATYSQFLGWARRSAEDPDLKAALEKVDLENFVRWNLLVQLAGTADMRQGALLLDLTDPDARWFCIPWDLDISLGVWSRGTAEEMNRVRILTDARGWRKDPRTMVVGPLLQHSEEFRSYFTTEFDRIDNHVLTEPFRTDLIDRYRTMAERFDIDPAFLELVDGFLERRPEALRRQFESRLGLGTSHDVEVGIPADVEVSIDGYSYARPYRGRYTEGSLLRLRLPENRPDLLWEIDGTRHPEPSAEVLIAGPATIRVISAE